MWWFKVMSRWDYSPRATIIWPTTRSCMQRGRIIWPGLRTSSAALLVTCRLWATWRYCYQSIHGWRRSCWVWWVSWWSCNGSSLNGSPMMLDGNIRTYVVISSCIYGTENPPSSIYLKGKEKKELVHSRWKEPPPRGLNSLGKTDRLERKDHGSQRRTSSSEP